jgi:hypothetical protein
MIIWGDSASARAMARRWRCPPETRADSVPACRGTGQPGAGAQQRARASDGLASPVHNDWLRNRGRQRSCVD